MQASSILTNLFGDNRAEWSTTNFKNLFVSPAYHTKLQSMRPCFLVGGRGTGKTTSLQSLRYDATFERLQLDGFGLDDQEFLGILVRMNKNRVRAFQNSGVTQAHWEKIFAHYFNLQACQELTRLAIWLKEKTEKTISSDSLAAISKDLCIAEVDTLEGLEKSIKSGISALQIYVNNPWSSENINLSMAESPLRTFVELMTEEGILGEKVVFCCIDEYENLLDYQQAVLNTYIKHAEPPLSYKVGVRINGLRNRQTLDGQDLLKTPDDYQEIQIADEGFELFAKAVAELRLKYAKKQGANVPETLDHFLEDLSFAEEAIMLGAEKVSKQVLEEVESLDKGLFKFLSAKPAHQVYFVKYWQESTNEDILDLVKSWQASEDKWDTRIGNYGFSSLFWLSKGNKGTRIRKYYCGHRVFLTLPAGNIRFFLELLDEAIGSELKSSNYNEGSVLTLSPKSQTIAVRKVGERRLNQLEGLADHGAQLKRLVLGIGKVFFEKARSPLGKTPEVTSFVLSGDLNSQVRVQDLLIEGVGHLAFEAEPRTKATTNLEIRDDEYRLHRIFSGYFEISYRKERRMTFDAADLLALLDDTPSKAISSLLEGRKQSDQVDLPEQLAIFGDFFNGGNE